MGAIVRGAVGGDDPIPEAVMTAGTSAAGCGNQMAIAMFWLWAEAQMEVVVLTFTGSVKIKYPRRRRPGREPGPATAPRLWSAASQRQRWVRQSTPSSLLLNRQQTSQNAQLSPDINFDEYIS